LQKKKDSMDKQRSDYFARLDAIALAMEEDFIQWIKTPDAELNQWWRTWVHDHPENADIVSDARAILLAIRPEEHRFPEEHLEYAWHKISKTYNLSRRQQNSIIAKRQFGWIAAAVLLGGLFLFSMQFFQPSRPFQVSTGVGQVAEVILPDNSKVMLNSKTTLVYEEIGFWIPMRRALVEGEAFFEVKPRKKWGVHQAFEVNTDPLQIKVLGTKFNVYHRRGIGRVFLQSGAVTAQNHAGQKAVTRLKPGYMATASLHSPKIVVRPIAGNQATAWKERKLVFDQTPLREVLNQLEDNFGFICRLETGTLSRKTFSGELPAGDVNLLIKAIEVSFDLKITRNNQLLIIQDKKPN
jgi:transmembrane sensor